MSTPFTNTKLELPDLPKSPYYTIIQQNATHTTYLIKIRDFFNYESNATFEEMADFPNVTNVNPNAKKQRKRKKDKSKKDNIICYPFLGLPFGQIAGVNALSTPKVVKSHILRKSIKAFYDASSISHRIEQIYDFLHGDYKTPILQGALQKDNLKELTFKYQNPVTAQSIDISNCTASEIFSKCEQAKNDYLNYEMFITVESSEMNANTRSRNNKFINSGGGFEHWEMLRAFENEVINYISDISFQTNEEENDKDVHPLFALENNVNSNDLDKGLVLKDEKDKNASFFENTCYLYYKSMSAVQKFPIEQWPNETEKLVTDMLCSLPYPTKEAKSWIKDMCDYGVKFFNEIGNTKHDLDKDFNSFTLLIYVIYTIEQKFGGKFKMAENDWSKFAKRINDICRTLTNSNKLLFESTWKPTTAADQTYPVFKFKTKANLLNFGLRLVLDKLFDTSKSDLGLTELGVVVQSLKQLSADDKRAIRTKQTKGEEIICDISARPYPIDELEYCHIEANSMGMLNSTEVNEPENIRLAHRRYNRMMGTMNYNAFKEHYSSNSKTIDTQLMLT